MIKKIELLSRIAEVEGQILWLEGRIDKLEAKKVKKVKKDEARK